MPPADKRSSGSAELSTLGDSIAAGLARCEVEFITPELPTAATIADYFSRPQNSIPACHCQKYRRRWLEETASGRYGLHAVIDLNTIAGNASCSQTLERIGAAHLISTLRTWHREWECKEFYVAEISPQAWPTILKSINRVRGFHVRIEEAFAASMTVVTTAADKLPGATAVDITGAIDLVTKLVRDGDFGAKSISLTHGWGINTRPKRDPKFEMIAECPQMSTATLLDLLKRNGVDYRRSPLETGQAVARQPRHSPPDVRPCST